MGVRRSTVHDASGPGQALRLPGAEEYSDSGMRYRLRNQAANVVQLTITGRTERIAPSAVSCTKYVPEPRLSLLKCAL
jgi:hypothetical protein